MTDSIKVMTGGYGYTTIDDMDAKIDAARLEGIRLGLEAAERAIEPLYDPQADDMLRDLNPDTIAREAVLDQLTSEAQADNMGYDNDPR